MICSLYVACIPQVAGRREHLSWRRNQLVGPFRIVPKILFLAQKNQEKSKENKNKELEAERVWKGKGECCFGSLQFYKVWKLHMPDWTEGIKERNRTEQWGAELRTELGVVSCGVSASVSWQSHKTCVCVPSRRTKGLLALPCPCFASFQTVADLCCCGVWW